MRSLYYSSSLSDLAFHLIHPVAELFCPLFFCGKVDGAFQEGGADELALTRS